MKIEIRSYSKDPNGKLCETWTLNQNGQAICDDASEQEANEIHGISSRGHRYYPKDGEAFLRNLPSEYANSSFIRAVIVE